MDPPRCALGACSWSLRLQSPVEVARTLRDCGLTHVQLALDPIRTGAWPIDEVRRAFIESSVTIASGMMAMEGEDYSTLRSIHTTGGLRPDATWPANRECAERNADIAAHLGIRLVTFHAGFLPPQTSNPLRSEMIARVRNIAEIFAKHGIRVALETGQESSATLLDCLGQLTDCRVGVNFDPANILLYASGDPITALRELLPYVAQLHIKDARRTRTPGEWGEEVRVGDGEVDWPAFFQIVRSASGNPILMIEREAGDSRVPDIRHAADFVRQRLALP